MKTTIYRGTHEIGGTLIALQSGMTKILIDAGFPLLLNGKPIEDNLMKLSPAELITLGVLPLIEGLYKWDTPSFDAVIISHAHIDHYGLLKYIHPSIPVFLSAGTKKLIELTQLFGICDNYFVNTFIFKMYTPFNVGDFIIKPYLMDHSAFDAAAFEISDHDKTVIYSGDFRGHGRKSVCLDYIIKSAQKNADALLIEGTMFGRQDEQIPTEMSLENELVSMCHNAEQIILYQTSSQNIDRIVSFYRAAVRCQKLFVVDIYTANVLYELKQLGNKLPYPSEAYPNLKVFYPYKITQKIFNEIGANYAKRFSQFYISREEVHELSNRIIMLVRPSMEKDLLKCGLSNGLFIYSMWQGYRDNSYQTKFENYLIKAGFSFMSLHTSGHASILDIKKLITGLQPKRVIPIHTMYPETFNELYENVTVLEDGKTTNI